MNELKRRIMELLNEQYEKDFIRGLGRDDLIQTLTCTETEFEQAVASLQANELVEKFGGTIGGHYYLRLSVKGKRKFDQVTRNKRNERLRQALLEKLNVLSQENPVIDSDSLAKELNETWNVVCFNLKDMEEDGLVKLKGMIGRGHPSHHVDLTPKGIEAYLNPPVDPNLCFVLMWFHENLREIYQNVIKPTIESDEVGMRCLRADEILGNNPIMDDIIAQIKKAGFIIADVTGTHCEHEGQRLVYTNPNVFFELGIAFAEEKEFIILTKSMDFVPFDLKHYRCIVYSNTPEGQGELRTKLIETIKAIRNAEWM